MTIKIIATLEELREWNVENFIFTNQIFRRHQYLVLNNMVGIRHDDDPNQMYGIPFSFVQVQNDEQNNSSTPEKAKLKFLRLFTEVVGGPNHGELISVWRSDTFDAFAEPENDYLWGYEKVPTELAIIRYRKAKTFVVFNNKYYIREFFICNSSDQDKAIRSFRNYFNPVFKK